MHKMRRGGLHTGRLKKAKTGIFVGHVDESSTIALAQQLDAFKTSNDKGCCVLEVVAWSDPNG